MERINTALTSYGKSGIVFHGPLLESHPGFVVKKVLERNLNNSAGKHPESILVRNYIAILTDPDIELVIINTPDNLHYDMAITALEAGKHIVVEKPFMLKTHEANEVIRLGKEKGLMVSVFQNRRWDGDFLTIKKVIDSGMIGELVSFESHFDRFKPNIEDSWKEERTIGSSVLYNLGSHMIDQALQLFGMPEYLFADVRIQRPGGKVNDSFDIFMHYPGVKCFVRGSYLVKEPIPRYILHGTKGSFLKSGIDPQEEMLEKGVIPGSINWGEEDPEFYGLLNTEVSGIDTCQNLETEPGNYLAYYDNIYNHLRNNEPLAVNAEQGRDVIRIIEAARESGKEGKVVVF